MKIFHVRNTTQSGLPEELKRLQLVLMKNSVSAGGQKTEESIVKENLESTFEVGLVAKACLDNPCNLECPDKM